jgi:hypothetical protein
VCCLCLLPHSFRQLYVYFFVFVLTFGVCCRALDSDDAHRAVFLLFFNDSEGIYILCAVCFVFVRLLSETKLDSK